MPDAAGASGGSCSVCKKPAKQFCSSCRAVLYCSKECQKRGWKEHKSKCRPFTEIRSHPIFGRHIVATRDIKPGEIVLKEAPLVVGPKQMSLPLCLGCHRTVKDYRCTKCGYPLCAPSCQNSKYHKAECAVLSNAIKPVVVDDLTQHNPAYACITILRCLLTRTTDPSRWATINDLQDHINDIKKGQLYEYFMVNIVHFLRKYIKYDGADEQTILRICGVLATNVFEIKHNGSRIRGLYNWSSKLAHSCVPNTKHTTEEDLTMVFRATTLIPKGTSITTSYTQTLWNTMARRQHLKMVKFFQCVCPRCTDPTELNTHFSTLLCVKCGGNVTPRQPLKQDADWSCIKCSHAMASKQVRWGDAVLYRELIELSKTSSPNSLENFLKKYKKTLHSQNRFFMEAKYTLIKFYGNLPAFRYRDMTREQLEAKTAWCRELLDLAEVIDPDMSLFRGSILFELQAVTVALAKYLLSNEIITKDGAKDYMAEASGHLEEASVILKHEPDMRDGGLSDRLQKLSEELDM